MKLHLIAESDSTAEISALLNRGLEVAEGILERLRI